VSEGGQEFENFSKKAVFLVSSGKNRISPLPPPLERLLEKSSSAPPWKKSFRVKLHHFCKNCVALHHLATLFKNTNAVNKP